MYKVGQRVIVDNENFRNLEGTVEGHGKHYKTKEVSYRVRVDGVPCSVSDDGCWVFYGNELNMVLKVPKLVDNGLIKVPDICIKYRGYSILPKLDFGGNPYQINGCVYKKGYVITYEACNVMPGGAWSKSIIEAKVMIDTLIESKTEGKGEFWDLLRERQGLTEWSEV